MHYNVNNRVVTKAQAFDPTLKALPGPAAPLEGLLKDLGIAGAPRIPQEGTVAIDSGGRVVTPTLMPVTAGVPELKGLTLSEALETAESVGLKPKFTGMGTVVAQSIETGTPFEQGAEILITLGHN